MGAPGPDSDLGIDLTADPGSSNSWMWCRFRVSSVSAVEFLGLARS